MTGQELWEKVRALRITQEEFSKISGVNRRTLNSHYQFGAREVPSGQDGKSGPNALYEIAFDKITRELNGVTKKNTSYSKADKRVGPNPALMSEMLVLFNKDLTTLRSEIIELNDLVITQGKKINKLEIELNKVRQEKIKV